MKRILFFSTLLLALSAQAAPGDMTDVYLRGHGIPNSNGLGFNWDNVLPDFRFKYGDNAGTWIYLTLDNFNVNGQEFAIGPDGWAQEKTIIAANPDGGRWVDGVFVNECYFGGGRNSKYPSNTGVKAIKVVLPTDKNTYDFNGGKNPALPGGYAGSGTVYIYTSIPDEIKKIEEVGDRPGIGRKSDYMIQAWSMENVDPNNPWDSAGGLFKPFRNDDGKFDLDPTYKYEAIGNYGEPLTYLCFNGPLNDEEIAKYPNARKYTNGAGFETYKDRLGMGDTAPETDSELYVIDFVSDKNPDGLYLVTPNRNEMDKTTYGTNPGDANYLHPFYRTGVRFGFFDNSVQDPGGEGGDLAKVANNYFRYQKWGHVFRLNEVTRPVNAFPQYNTDGSLAGFKDDFGPAQWNGIDATEWKGGQLGNDHVSAPGNNYLNKKGDCRILAEHNFWLRRIFLEVAVDDHGHKHFYMSFIGTPDLMAGSDSKYVEHYVPANQNVESHRNYVNGQPNIFPGVDIMTNEMGFQRYFNLNRNNCQEMIGFLPENYPWDENGNLLQETNVQRVMGKYLYNLNLQDGYTVTSTYKVLDTEGNVVEIDGKGLTRTIRYRGQNGGYYQYNEETSAYDIPLSTKTGDKIFSRASENLTNPELKIFIEPQTTSLLFDPQADKRPAKLVITNNYRFDRGSQAEGMNYEVEFPIDLTHTPDSNEIPVTVVAGSFEHRNYYETEVNWNGFETLSGENGHYPVTPYVVSAIGTAPEYGDQCEAQLPFETISTGDWTESGDLGLGTHRYTYPQGPNRAPAQEMTEPVFQMHYKVESQYNYAYVQGVATELPEAAYSTVAEPDENGYMDVELENGLKYQIRPEKITGRAHVTFEQTTGVDEISVDGDGETIWYNLQGVRVDRPDHGVFIKVTDGKAVKTVL